MDLKFEVARMKVNITNDQKLLAGYQNELKSHVRNEKIETIACFVFMSMVVIFSIWAMNKMTKSYFWKPRDPTWLKTFIKAEVGIVLGLSAGIASVCVASLAGKPISNDDPLNKYRGLLAQVDMKIKK